MTLGSVDWADVERGLAFDARANGGFGIVCDSTLVGRRKRELNSAIIGLLSCAQESEPIPARFYLRLRHGRDTAVRVQGDVVFVARTLITFANGDEVDLATEDVLAVYI